MLRSVYKDVLLPHYVSSVIYKCQCEAEYMGRTNKRMEIRTEQHAPAKIRLERCDNLHKLVNTTEHLINKPVCAMSFIREGSLTENIRDIMH